jgi:amidase
LTDFDLLSLILLASSSVPAGMCTVLPVGMMLIGRHWEDGTVLRAADAFQKIA